VNYFWTDHALDLLADIYSTLTVTRQRALAATVERVNQELADHPLDVGEGRAFPNRVWIVPPVVVWYQVTAAGVEVGGITKS